MAPPFVAAIGFLSPLVVAVILWAIWKDQHPLAARLLAKWFAIKLGVSFALFLVWVLLFAIGS